MGEILSYTNIKKESGWLYFLDKHGDISRTQAKRGGRKLSLDEKSIPEKVARVGIVKERGWLYYVDGNGNVGRSALKRGGTRGSYKRKAKVRKRYKSRKEYLKKHKYLDCGSKRYLFELRKDKETNYLNIFDLDSKGKIQISLESLDKVARLLKRFHKKYNNTVTNKNIEYIEESPGNIKKEVETLLHNPKQNFNYYREYGMTLREITQKYGKSPSYWCTHPEELRTIFGK